MNPHWVSLDILRGMALGLAVAAPIGPTAALCIERTLAGGAMAGIAIGYGAATTHMGYAAVAATGLAAMAREVSNAGWFATALQLGCVAFLIHLAVRTARRPIAVPRRGAIPRAFGDGLAGPYVIGLCWTLGNPVTLLSFAALSPGFAGSDSPGVGSLATFALGVFLGSASWWTALAGCVAMARGWMGARTLRTANAITAGMMILGAMGILRRSGLWH